MRLIDADKLKTLKSIQSADFNSIETIRQWIDSAPSIEIIRCRECKYWKSTVQMPNGTEVKCLYGRKADDFCSYGEREGE